MAIQNSDLDKLKAYFMHECLRCRYPWLSTLQKPVLCPRCKSPRWFMPRIKEAMKP